MAMNRSRVAAVETRPAASLLAKRPKPNGYVAATRLSSDDEGSSGSVSDTSDSSGDGEEVDEVNGDQDAKAAMLALLEARGRAMFGGNDDQDQEEPSVSRKGRRNQTADDDGGSDAEDASDASEFYGFDPSGSDFADSDSDSLGTDEEGFDEDDGLEGGAANERSMPTEVPTVVFDDSRRSDDVRRATKAEYKRFMSASSAKMMDLAPKAAAATTNLVDKAEDEEDKHNVALDKQLHRMLMTTVLPSAASHSRPIDKRNALSGRLLEIASMADLGAGSSKIAAETQQVNFPGKMKMGINKAKMDREEKARATAEAAGSWVKGLGGLGDAGGGKGAKTAAQRKRDEKRLERKDRDRGLAMGIGKFQGGMLRLNKAEIARGNEERSSSRGGSSSRGKGGSRGKGKKR